MCAGWATCCSRDPGPYPFRVTTVDQSLPGAEIVEPGLADVGRGAVTVNSLLVSMAATRLRSAGLAAPERAVECAG